MLTGMSLGEVAIVSAIVIFFVRILWTLERLLTMHTNADKHGFGTDKTNRLLEQHISQETDMHTATIHVMERLDITIDRLGQFIEKLIEVQTGMPVIPPRAKL